MSIKTDAQAALDSVEKVFQAKLKEIDDRATQLKRIKTSSTEASSKPVEEAVTSAQTYLTSLGV
jgi:hypothetical protein